MDEDAAPPSDKFTTAEPNRLLVTISFVAQFKPASTLEPAATLSSPITFTAMRFVFLATPYVFEPITPATWVPWPVTSALLELAAL